MNNYKRLETRIKNLEQKKQKKELIISKAQETIKGTLFIERRYC